MTPLRLGTRGSTLALTQSRQVARAVEEASGILVELEVITTRGDREQSRPLPEIGGKGLFTAELDRALLEGDVDFAVHSLKDLPTDQPTELTLACVPEREDPRDVLVGPTGGTIALDALPRGAVLGTSSLRRKALALAFRPDLDVRPVRGNLDTRLDKVDAGVYDALVLAAAGIRRLGREERIGEWLERTAWLPAPGQGALAVVARSRDDETLRALEPLHDVASAAAVIAERAVLAALEGGCQVPIGATAIPYGHGLRLWGLVASPDGKRVVRDDVTGDLDDPEALGLMLADSLRTRGADDILSELREAAVEDPRLT
ncbi:MAG: hydroxymethylbilane synthase [Gemmatimonadota bacterium]|jgi:hydroxymethylbilane synthase